MVAKKHRFVISEAEYISDDNAILEWPLIGFDSFETAKQAFMSLAENGRTVYLWTRDPDINPILYESVAYLKEYEKIKD